MSTRLPRNVLLPAWFCVAVLFTTPARAQSGPGATFLQLLRTYRGDQLAGVRALVSGPDRELEAQLKACRGTRNGTAVMPDPCSRRDFLTAAMLFTDTASGIIASQPGRADRLIRQGVGLLKVMREDYPDHTGAESRFIAAWFAHSARVFLSQRYLSAAIRLVNEGLSLFPKSAELYVARGVVFETPTAWTNDIDAAVRYRYSVFPNEAKAYGTTPLNAAASQYREALSIDASHFGATVRLAWIDTRQGARTLEAPALALERAAPGDERYLAHLVMGAAAERLGNLPTAIAAYSKSWEAGPRYQAACTALASAHARMGEATLASDIATQCLANVAAPDDETFDPWLSLLFGVPETTLSDWLHAEARRP